MRRLREKAARLKDAINARFWLPQKGYYAYYLDAGGEPDTRMEGLGEAFAILTGVADSGLCPANSSLDADNLVGLSLSLAAV